MPNAHYNNLVAVRKEAGTVEGTMSTTPTTRRNKAVAGAVGLAVAGAVIGVGVLALRGTTTVEETAQAPAPPAEAVATARPSVGGPDTGTAPTTTTPDGPAEGEAYPDDAFGGSFPDFQEFEEVVIEEPNADVFDPNLPLPPPAPSVLPTESPIEPTGVTFIHAIDVPYVEGFTARQWKYELSPRGQSYTQVCAMLRQAIEAKGYTVLVEACEEGVMVQLVFQAPTYQGITSIVADNFVVVEAR